MDSGSSCKTSAYLAPMVVILVLLVAILAFALWYYFAQLKPRTDMLVMDKMTGSVGFKDTTNAQLLLSPPSQAGAGQSSRISVINPQNKSQLNFTLFTVPIPNNAKQQVQVVMQSPQGMASLPLTS